MKSIFLITAIITTVLAALVGIFLVLNLTTSAEARDALTKVLLVLVIIAVGSAVVMFLSSLSKKN